MTPAATPANALSPLHSAALDCLERGWSPIPLHPRSKKPSLPWQAFQTRHATEAEVCSWPAESNLGVVTGSISGLVVVDVDGPEGQEAFTARCDGVLPYTPTVKTGKGLHLYFNHPGGQVTNRVGLLSKVDLRGDGGFVVMPPSVHENGTTYEWVVSPDAERLAELPPWVPMMPPAPIMCYGPNGTEIPCPPVAYIAGYSFRPIPPGYRNDALYRLTRSIRYKMSEADVRATVHYVNREFCHPPLPPAEVNRLLDHALRQPDRPRVSGVVR